MNPWSYLWMVFDFVCLISELKEAVEDVLPSLVEQGVTVLLIGKHCDGPGFENFSDRVERAPDSPPPQSLRSHVTLKSPAVYIYTSGTTGKAGAGQTAVWILWFVLPLTPFITGLPKAAVVNQNRLLTVLAVLSSNGVKADDVIYLNLPLYHTAGFFIGFIGSIETGEMIWDDLVSDLSLMFNFRLHH